MKISMWFYVRYAYFVTTLRRLILRSLEKRLLKIIWRIAPRLNMRYRRYRKKYFRLILKNRIIAEFAIIRNNIIFTFNNINLINSRIDLIITDGFLIDNLQKKLYNNWSRKFLIHSVYLFNDRWFFERISRCVLENLLWPLKEILYIDGFNVASAVHPVILMFFFSFTFLNLCVLINCCGTDIIMFVLHMLNSF